MTMHTITKHLTADELRDLLLQSIASANEQALCDMAQVALEAIVTKSKAKKRKGGGEPYVVYNITTNKNYPEFIEGADGIVLKLALLSDSGNFYNPDEVRDESLIPRSSMQVVYILEDQEYTDLDLEEV